MILWTIPIPKIGCVYISLSFGIYALLFLGKIDTIIASHQVSFPLEWITSHIHVHVHVHVSLFFFVFFMQVRPKQG